MNGFKNNNQVKTETSTSLNYFNLLKSNLGTVLLISLVIFLFTLLYVILAQDVYKSNAVLKISEPQGKNILDSPFEAALGSSSTDRYIANEIGVMMNRTIREEVARAVIDSFKVAGNKNNFDLLFYDNNIFSDTDKKVRSDQSLAAQFLENVEIKQMEGLSFIEIAVESGSPSEAALIANSYAKVYKDFNLADSRKQLTKLKEFLADQRDEKFNELITAEDNLKVYQIQGGGVELGQQALTLIQTTSQFEADKNRVQIEMSMAKESL
ncbi:MAG: hypothetical protein KDC52_07245 [Ignavibacteriae bacterium]|nr:hypothetical protein [Ignavibacteriota bacterium]